MRISEFIPEHPRGALEFNVEERMVNGKMRTLAIPSEALAEAHLQLHHYLQRALQVKLLSPVKNAAKHKSSLYFFQTDLKDAFPSLDPRRLSGVLCQLLFEAGEYIGSYDEVAEFLGKYCFIEGHGLAQGAPASPVLFELYCRWYIDRQVRDLLDKQRKKGCPYVVYTRYVDDLTISSRHPISKYLRTEIKRIVRGAGFAVDPNKTTYFLRERHDVVVTGVRILRGGNLRHTQEFLSSLKLLVSRAKKEKVMDEKDSQKLQGLVAYFFELLKVWPRKSSLSRKDRQVLDFADAGEYLVEQRLCKLREERKLRKGLDKKRFPKQWLQELRSKIDICTYVVGTLKGTWLDEGPWVSASCPLSNCATTYYKHRRLKVWKSRNVATFGCACIQHGDVITFAMAYHSWSFSTACVQLAKSVGLALPPEYYRRFGAYVAPVQLSWLPNED